MPGRDREEGECHQCQQSYPCLMLIGSRAGRCEAPHHRLVTLQRPRIPAAWGWSCSAWPRAPAQAFASLAPPPPCAAGLPSLCLQAARHRARLQTATLPAMAAPAQQAAYYIAAASRRAGALRPRVPAARAPRLPVLGRSELGAPWPPRPSTGGCRPGKMPEARSQSGRVCPGSAGTGFDKRRGQQAGVHDSELAVWLRSCRPVLRLVLTARRLCPAPARC